MEISAEKITTDDEQSQWHPDRDQSKRVESGYSNKLQISWSSCIGRWL